MRSLLASAFLRRISRYGIVAFASSLDHCGVLTRSVEDAAIVVDNMKGIDKYDMTSWDSSNMDLTNLDGNVIQLQVNKFNII